MGGGGWDILVRTEIFSSSGKTFSKAKNNILWLLNINETKISVICVYKEYEVKMKMVQEQRLQLKIKIWWVAFFLVQGNEQTFN